MTKWVKQVFINRENGITKYMEFLFIYWEILHILMYHYIINNP